MFGLHAHLLLFFFNDTATTEIYTLSLHDALPISLCRDKGAAGWILPHRGQGHGRGLDRKSTRLNSSHLVISYAVFCLKKKNAAELPEIQNEQDRRPGQKQRRVRGSARQRRTINRD